MAAHARGRASAPAGAARPSWLPARKLPGLTPSPPSCPFLATHPNRCRATTVYLVQRRIDMLPKPLTEDICSLR